MISENTAIIVLSIYTYIGLCVCIAEWAINSSKKVIVTNTILWPIFWVANIHLTLKN